MTQWQTFPENDNEPSGSIKAVSLFTIRQPSTFKEDPVPPSAYNENIGLSPTGEQTLHHSIKEHHAMTDEDSHSWVTTR
jgi:hypothetical protein